MMQGLSRVDVSSSARLTSRIARWRGAGALCFAVSVACAVAPGRGQGAGKVKRCPPGTHHYGDGMVASLLPEEATAALVRARAMAVQEAGPNQSSFLADQPWRPHVSVIYGVTENRAAPAYQAMQSFLNRSQSASACFGRLQYWDDKTDEKTTLIVDVIESDGLLKSLHDVLAEATHIGSRFSYHPHVTLLYLKLHARLSGVQERAVLAPIENRCWRTGAFYLTDPCGQELYRAQAPSG